jgi:hypothetical protein
MRLPGFRVRTLMIVVAIIAALCYCRILQRRRTEFLSRATNLANNEQFYRGLEPVRSATAQRLEFLRLAERFAKQRRAYERAARYPWLPVPPEPPEPK